MMDLLYVILFLILSIISITAEPPEYHTASQCFKSAGIPKVRFSCGYDKMIVITKAFHGIPENRAELTRNSYGDESDSDCPPNPGHQSNNCSFCRKDCIDDSMNLVYDWSTCMGNSSCERTVMQSYIPSCQGDDKFSHYLQTQYQCVPRSDVIDICSNIDRRFSSGYLMSPGYPNHYPPNQDCMCTIEAEWATKVKLSFYDLLLQTKRGRCRADWLMLREGGQKHRHCGAIMTGIKDIYSEGQSINLQFHSDSDNNSTQNFQYFVRHLKGFWLKFGTADDSNTQLHVTCRVMTQQDKEVQEINQDDLEFEEVLSTNNEDEEDDDNRNTNGNNITKKPKVDNSIKIDSQQKGTKTKYDKQNKVNKQSADKQSEVDSQISSAAVLCQNGLVGVVLAVISVVATIHWSL